jgi:hypothetical protein
MKTWVSIAAILMIAMLCLPVGAQDLELSGRGNVVSTARDMIEVFPTSQTMAATQYNYGPVVYVGDAQALSGIVLKQGCAAGSSTIEWIEWLWGDPTDAVQYGIYTAYGASADYRNDLIVATDITSETLRSGNPSFHDRMFLWTDKSTTGVTTVVANGNYWFYTTVKAPYMRYVTYNVAAQKAAFLGTVYMPTTTAWIAKRFRVFPAVGREEPADNLVNPQW